MKSLIAAALIATLPAAAFAVTTHDFIEDLPLAGDSYADGGTDMLGQNELNFKFTSTVDDYRLDNIGLVALGSNPTDIAGITFSLNGGAYTPLVFFVAGSGFAPIADQILDIGDMFTVTVLGDFINKTTVSLAFNAGPNPAPPPGVPLPAAGWLLGTALVGGGFMSRKKKA